MTTTARSRAVARRLKSQPDRWRRGTERATAPDVIYLDIDAAKAARLLQELRASCPPTLGGQLAAFFDSMKEQAAAVGQAAGRVMADAARKAQQ